MSDLSPRSPAVLTFRRRPAGIGARLVELRYTVDGAPERALTTIADRDEALTELLKTRPYVGGYSGTPSRPQRQPKLRRSTRPTHDDTPPGRAA